MPGLFRFMQTGISKVLPTIAPLQNAIILIICNCQDAYTQKPCIQSGLPDHKQPAFYLCFPAWFRSLRRTVRFCCTWNMRIAGTLVVLYNIMVRRAAGGRVFSDQEVSS